MKMKILAIVFLFVIVSLNSYAGDINNTTEINGSANFKNMTFESLEMNGSLDFENITIKNDLEINGSASGNGLNCRKFDINGSLEGKNITAEYGEVNGSLDGKNITIKNDLTVNGSMDGENIKVGGKTMISGELSASNSTFNNIEIKKTCTEDSFFKFLGNIFDTKSEEIKLENSEIQNILVDVKGVKIKLILSGKTVVSGDIIFKSDKGEIYLDKNAKINRKVRGGKIMKILTST